MSIRAVFFLSSPEHDPQVGGTPAPFVRVAGVELLTRQILTAIKNGAEKVWIAPGPHAERARALLSSDQRLKDQPVEIAGSLGEALDQAAAADEGGRMLIAGPDVLFGPDVVSFAAQSETITAPVRWDEERALFFAPASALKGLGADKAAEAITGAQPMHAKDQPYDKRAFVVPIASPADVKQGKKAIFSIVTKPTSGWVSRNLNSKLSIPLSKFLSEYPITPNMITLLTTIVGFSCFPFLIRGDYLGTFMGGLLFQLAAALDRSDGEIARSKFLASDMGEWIDTIGDNLTYILFLIGLTIGTRERTGHDYILWIGIGLIVLAAVVLGLMYRYLLTHTKSGSLVAVYKDMEAKFEGKEKPLTYRILDKIRFMGKRDFYSMLVFVLCAFNLLELTFWAAIITVLCILAYLMSGKSKLPTADASA